MTAGVYAQLEPAPPLARARRVRARRARACLARACFACACLMVSMGQTRAAAAPVRGEILDRRGIVLATTVESPSLYANPRRIVDAGATAAALAARIEGLDVAALRGALSRETSFVWVARHVGDDQVRAVMSLGLQGIGVKHEPMRRYPQGPLASHVVGFTDAEASAGLAGVELSCDTVLRHGQPVRLSIDLSVQEAVRSELSSALVDYGARAAAGIVLDASSAEILALVSLPDYDPTDRASIAPLGYKNRVTSDVYELGGLFEIFTMAAALEAHRVDLTTRLRVPATLRIGAHVVRDDEPAHTPLSVADVFARSSLIGAALIAERSSPQEQQAALRSMGLLDPMRVELAESVGAPLVRYRAWGPYLRTTIGYGYGIALTPLQATAVATAVVHHGLLIEPTVLARSGNPPPGRSIVSETTSAHMRELLRAAVVRGTGHEADVPGYAVGGKTGTALELTADHYDRAQRRTWFFAGFPMTEAPRYTLLVMLDDPRRPRATAEWNAVPSAGRIIERIGPLLGTAPLSMAQSRTQQPLIRQAKGLANRDPTAQESRMLDTWLSDAVWRRPITASVETPARI